MKNSKILIIGCSYPSKLDNGKSVVLKGILEFFKRVHGEENIKYIVIGSEEYDYKEKIVSIKKPNLITQLTNVALRSFIANNKSIQESILYSKKNKKKIDYEIDNWKPDLIIADTVRIAQFLSPGKNIHVYLDDLFSIRYQKMLETMERHPQLDLNSLGNFKKFLPPFVHHMLKFNYIERKLLKKEKDLINKSEVKIGSKFNCMLINNHEVEVLKKRLRNSTELRINEIKPWMSLSESKYARKIDKDNPVYIFLGSLNIPHNRVSITNFLKTQILSITELLPTAKVKVIGSNPSKELLDLEKKYPNNIEIMGFVEDLDKELSRATAMIVPLMFGTGVKLKTIDALSKGVPLISTDYGVEGIEVQNEVQCIVENDFNNFPHHMVEISEVDKNSTYSEKALKFFNEKYSEEAIFENYSSLFNGGK